MISRLNRSTETVAASSYGSTFTTTVRPSALSRATKTVDMPPTAELALEGVGIA